MFISIVILGLLIEGDKHPYEFRQIIKDRQMHHYIKMQDGSLYYAVEQLCKKGFIEIVKVVRDSNRPDKTIYRITEEGKQHFETLLEEQLLKKSYFYQPIYSGIAFAKHADQDKLIHWLKEKIVALEQQSHALKQLFDEHNRKGNYRNVLHLILSIYEQSQTELRCIKRILKDAESGILAARNMPLDINGLEN